MNKFDIEKIVWEQLEKCGIKIPVEEKFDYSQVEEKDKCKNFIRLTNGNWTNAIYIKKNGQRYGDEQYFDLLFVINEEGEPICVPVPIARKLFKEDIVPTYCRETISGVLYEYIYRNYYEKISMPF